MSSGPTACPGRHHPRSMSRQETETRKDAFPYNDLLCFGRFLDQFYHDALRSPDERQIGTRITGKRADCHVGAFYPQLRNSLVKVGNRKAEMLQPVIGKRWRSGHWIMRMGR